tara:strand:- start:2995 stop:3375 length:381 start_codon:yes stop_codon:yes gene_type:complete
MYILIKVGGVFGVFNTIALVLLTALIGIALLRHQGFRTLLNARNKIMQSELPAEEIIAGIFLAIGGVLLLTPGFVTDFIGFLFLVPFTRSWFITLIYSNFFFSSGFSHQNKREKTDWIEGDFKKEK